jgi:hypothetical protein
MNTYYKAVKLTTGELLAFKTDEDITGRQLNDQRYINIQDPVSFYSFRFLEDGRLGEVVGMQPWVPITLDEKYPLAVHSIVTIANMEPRAIASYEQFLSNGEEGGLEEIDVSDDEGMDEEMFMLGELDPKTLH